MHKTRGRISGRGEMIDLLPLWKRLRRAAREELPRAQVVTERVGGLWSGDIVRDYEVVGDYPDARSRAFRAYDWPNEALTETTLSVLGPAPAVVTAGYLSIDPVRGRLFLNHGYNGLRALYPGVNDFLQDTTFHFERATAKAVSGRAVVIGGPYDKLYFHWLLSWCLRFSLLEILAPEVLADPSAQFLIDRRAAEEPYRSFLVALGIADERIVWIDPGDGPYVIEEAIQTSLPNELLYYPDLIHVLADRLRRGFGIASTERTRRRIWVSRQALPAPRRRIVNVDAIAPVLARFGIEEVVLEHLSPREQARLFAEAEFVGGVHGAGLVNMIFSAPGTRILSVEKEFNRMGRLDRCFTGLASVCGLQAEAIYATTPPLEGIAEPSMVDLHLQDVIIDPEELASVLERILA